VSSTEGNNRRTRNGQATGRRHQNVNQIAVGTGNDAGEGVPAETDGCTLERPFACSLRPGTTVYRRGRSRQVVFVVMTVVGACA
jgi:hypothetical protein